MLEAFAAAELVSLVVFLRALLGRIVRELQLLFNGLAQALAVFRASMT